MSDDRYEWQQTRVTTDTGDDLGDDTGDDSSDDTSGEQHNTVCSYCLTRSNNCTPWPSHTSALMVSTTKGFTGSDFPQVKKTGVVRLASSTGMFSPRLCVQPEIAQIPASGLVYVRP